MRSVFIDFGRVNVSSRAYMSCMVNSTILQTKVTPIVEGYGGWAFRMEIVPIESAYPGFGELVVSTAYLHCPQCDLC